MTTYEHNVCVFINPRLHDFDNNTMLDGLEIFKALTHLQPYADVNAKETVEKTGKSLDQVQQEKQDAELKYYAGMVYCISRYITITYFMP